jgi:hypothetical protein
MHGLCPGALNKMGASWPADSMLAILFTQDFS